MLLFFHGYLHRPLGRAQGSRGNWVKLGLVYHFPDSGITDDICGTISRHGQEYRGRVLWLKGISVESRGPEILVLLMATIPKLVLTGSVILRPQTCTCTLSLKASLEYL